VNGGVGGGGEGGFDPISVGRRGGGVETTIINTHTHTCANTQQQHTHRYTYTITTTTTHTNTHIQ